MAIALVVTGTLVASGTGATVAYPAGIAAGDLLLLPVAVKIDTVTMPTISGWTVVSDVVTGTGTAGVGTGPHRQALYQRVADSTDVTKSQQAATIAITTSPTASAVAGVIQVWRADSGLFDTILTTSGSDVTSNTTLFVTGAANLFVAAGDVLINFIVASANVSLGAPSTSATGATTTTTTERADGGTANGNRIRIVLTDVNVSGGPSTGAPATSNTASAATTGGVMFIRLREKAIPDVAGSAGFSGGGDMSASGVVNTAGSASFSGGGAMTAAGTSSITGAAAFSGGGTMTASGSSSSAGSAAFTGGGTMSATGSTSATGTAAFTGGGTMSASGTVTPVASGGRAKIAGLRVQAQAATRAARMTALRTVANTSEKRARLVELRSVASLATEKRARLVSLRTVAAAPVTPVLGLFTGTQFRATATYWFNGTQLIPLDGLTRYSGEVAPTLPAMTKTAAGVLMAGGSPLRMAGANQYWAITTDAINPGNLAATPQADRVEALDILREMNHNVIRAHTLFIGYGKVGTQQPSATTWDEAVLVRCDEYLAELGARGQYGWGSLTDSWDYFHGGGITFARMILNRPDLTAEQAQLAFCTDPKVVQAFLASVAYRMNRVNTVTGVKWGDDPTLAVIETANEGWQAPFVTTQNAATGGVPWHAYIARWLKANYPSKLVADGSATSSGDPTPGQGAVIPAYALGNPDFDIVGTHLYDNLRNAIPWVRREAARARAAGQAFVVGEADFRDVAYGAPAIQNSGTTRAAFLDYCVSDPNVSGYLWWAPQVNGRSNTTDYELPIDAPVKADHVAAKAELTDFAARFKTPPATTAGRYSATYSATY